MLKQLVALAQVLVDYALLNFAGWTLLTSTYVTNRFQIKKFNFGAFPRAWRGAPPINFVYCFGKTPQEMGSDSEEEEVAHGSVWVPALICFRAGAAAVAGRFSVWVPWDTDGRCQDRRRHLSYCGLPLPTVSREACVYSSLIKFFGKDSFRVDAYR
ncbi:hypothetical protein PUN28_020493 [Cardiocondyla obscurior]|uniref:Uncharacterized protein n=1 Tax=Cardiocondyla obscurior TaxID=286306 RepID=A0AAW2E5I7_9HYME